MDDIFFTGNSSTTRIFATQNPYKDGSGRKGLPKSFMNRFVKVFVEPLTPKDAVEICRHRFPHLDEDKIRGLVDLIRRVNAVQSAWDFNLRDLIKLCQGLTG